MNILFASSEVYPFSKTGGLGDVAHSLPLAIKQYLNISVATPLYDFIDRKKYNIVPFLESFTLILNSKEYKIEFFKTNFNGIETIFIYEENLCKTNRIYGLKNDGLRFGIFSYAIAHLATKLMFDTIHLNDWHTALTALFLKDKKDIKTLLTIHNIAYQGIFDKSILKELEIDEKYFNMEALEFYNRVNFLKGGIAFSDFITTVSPTYAKEIQTKEFGCALEGFIKKYSYKLKGILNGIDTKMFNPATDSCLDDLNINKQLKSFDTQKAIFIFIGRLVEQKGIDLLMECFDEFSLLNIELIILGDGKKDIANSLQEASNRYKNIYFLNGYNECLAHQLYALADFLLMPSRFEPCGLNQMIAARYRAIPIVHSVGGLKDSVFENKKRCIQGFCFSKFSKEELLKAVKRALKLYNNKDAFEKILNFNQKCDVSFKKSAKEYIKIYLTLQGKRV